MVYFIAFALGLTLSYFSYHYGYAAGHRDGLLFSHLLGEKQRSATSDSNSFDRKMHLDHPARECVGRACNLLPQEPGY